MRLPLVALCALAFLPMAGFSQSAFYQPLTLQQVKDGINDTEKARESQLEAYQVTERYTMTRGHSNAVAGDMVVDVSYTKGRGKEYVVRSQTGSAAVKLVFNKILQRQQELSREPLRHQVIITTDNYNIELPDQSISEINGVKTRKVTITPLKPKDFLINGSMWIDSHFHPVRIEGVLSATPSIFTGRPTLERDYQDVGAFALATHYKSLSHELLFGQTVVEVQYVDYHDIRGDNTAHIDSR